MTTPTYRLAALALTALACGSPATAQDGECASRPFAPALTADGNVWGSSYAADGWLYTFRSREGRENYRIARSRRDDQGRWTPWEPVRLGGDHSDLYPAVSPDGEHLVFLSYRPVPEHTGRPTANLWHARRDGDGWGLPTFLADISDPSRYESQAAFGDDGALYFRRDEPGGRVSTSLVTRWTGSGWTTPEADTLVERWRGWRDGLHVWGGRRGPGGRFVLLDVSPLDPQTGRRGPSDQWLTVRQPDGSWSEPQPAGCGLNHDGYDTFPLVTPAGDSLVVVQAFGRYRAAAAADVLADHAARRGPAPRRERRCRRGGRVDARGPRRPRPLGGDCQPLHPGRPHRAAPRPALPLRDLARCRHPPRPHRPAGDPRRRAVPLGPAPRRG